MNKILIIEDEPQIRNNLKQVLDIEGFSVFTAEDGDLGLQMVKQVHPDLIICDVMMPKCDGYGLIQALHQEPLTATIPVIFLTAKAEYSDMRQAMALGADDYLTKPFEIDEVLQAISTQLKKREVVIQPYVEQVNQMQSEINYIARHDHLTGLPNQILLEEKFNQTLIESYGQNQLLPLLLIDLNILHRVQLLVDPTLRDSLLQAVTSRCDNYFNSAHDLVELIAYLKTGQLAFLLKPTLEIENAGDISQTIINILCQPFFIDNQEIILQPKIGIACYPRNGITLSQLITYAEIAINECTEKENSFYNFYTQEIGEKYLRKKILEANLWTALDKNEFKIYYQPQINLLTQDMVGVEALIRWQHPEYGLVSPAEFIPLAEETGFIIYLGAWILKTACQQVQEWQAQKLGIFNLAVNLSAYEFRNPHLNQSIIDTLVETNFDPKHLELELTETLLVQNIDYVSEEINKLRSYGIKIAIDDFGTGYSSLKYLQDFAFDFLKIDSYFVNRIDKNTNKQAIVKSIIQIANNLGVDLIAEGVETQYELAWLRDNHCDVMQGYLFSPPLPPEALEKFLLSRK
ncbi:diguanylate cyclase GGDEF domain protein [Richelia sinica FACHB-800]|uniref:Diguanylate cyclase GGDEF domain protein n=1 Tax=Richelia sinica FACHB-800 TaxID=1357546 RepID=A0A975Y6T1_9NOST|nr:EAL domain-containing protein [Richelia sinica]MBD2667157.1 EAL domain-containing protein [Richelia sinica FACHB-800]QXE25606.1 diguanylate cyclase GGDEF domain protein [Richelia sinica FACHB-800]